MLKEIHAILLCDHIITDDRGKKSAIGIFNYLYAKNFPISIPLWKIMLIGECESKKVKITIILENEEQVPLVKIESDMEIHKPPYFEVGFAFPVIINLEKPGKYSIKAFIDDELKKTKTFITEKVKELK
ncbi:MAG: hypothetical protein HPY53_04875 [Brevinematales bacterium]|nr:hypothetical protein [Brevinematales bacterium]